MPNKHLHATVHGRVQMVGFRYFVLAHAERLGITGWVRNGSDGRSVELVAEGDPDALTELETLLQQGPPGAFVDVVDGKRSDVIESHARFDVRL